MIDFGFYIDSKGRTVVECQCGSFVVFQQESISISRICFRCGQPVERPIELTQHIEEEDKMAPEEDEAERREAPDDVEDDTDTNNDEDEALPDLEDDKEL